MPTKAIFKSILILLFLSTTVLAGELEKQITEIQTNAISIQSVAKKIIKKESRFVPVGIPVSNPTIGLGLAAAIVYMHPHEYDPTEMGAYKTKAPLKRRLSQGLGRKAFPGKIDKLLAEFRFTSMRQILKPLLEEMENAK